MAKSAVMVNSVGSDRCTWDPYPKTTGRHQWKTTLTEKNREESECPQHEHTESNMPEGEGLAFVHK